MQVDIYLLVYLFTHPKMQDCVVSSKQKVVTCCVLIYEHASTKQTKNRQYPERTAGCHKTYHIIARCGLSRQPSTDFDSTLDWE